MSEHKEHISQYSAADIQQYVQGKLSAREMHAMELAALDDPFLADAIEGMQQAFAEHSESLVTGQLQQLQQQFTTRTASTGKLVAFKPFRYWQAAAAALVVIITGVWVYSLLNDNSAASEKNTVAKTEETAPAPQQTIPTPPATDEEKDITGVDSVVFASPRTNSKQQPLTPDNNILRNKSGFFKDDKRNGANNNLSPAPPATQPGKVAWHDNDSVALKDVAAEAKEAPVPTPTQELAKARRDSYDAKVAERETELITIAQNDNFKKKAFVKDKNLSGFVKGQVTDVNHNPVANAYIQLYKQTNNNFVTDKSGFFKIPVTDSVVDVAVNVSGYGTQSFRLQNLATVNQLQLQPANATLPNTPVQNNITLRGASSNTNTVPNVMVHDAEPAFGWVAFEQYLEKNKKAPDSVKLRGNVLVSFEVNKKGHLSDFKITQPLSKAHNDEAIRLIMQGPSWAPVNGKRKARVTVMVRF